MSAVKYPITEKKVESSRVSVDQADLPIQRIYQCLFVLVYCMYIGTLWQRRLQCIPQGNRPMLLLLLPMKIARDYGQND